MSKNSSKCKENYNNNCSLPFTEYYSLLPNPKRGVNPRTKLLVSISSLTKKSLATVRRWALGNASPAPLEKQIIANLLNSDVDTLFPNN